MQSRCVQEIDKARQPVITAALPLPAEDQARADLYALAARLLLSPPDSDLLAGLAAADSIASRHSDSPLDLAWEKLTLTASIIDPYAVHDEFNELFISSGTPQINPYGSLYLSGFMNEKPLAQLRSDLARLGLVRAPGVGELEDHLGALCESMRLLIAGEQGSQRQGLECQQEFFEMHIRPWYGRCLADIRNAQGAQFYRYVADFTEAFLSIEAQAFEIGDACFDDAAISLEAYP